MLGSLLMATSRLRQGKLAGVLDGTLVLASRRMLIAVVFTALAKHFMHVQGSLCAGRLWASTHTHTQWVCQYATSENAAWCLLADTRCTCRLVLLLCLVTPDKLQPGPAVPFICIPCSRVPFRSSWYLLFTGAA